MKHKKLLGSLLLAITFLFITLVSFGLLLATRVRKEITMIVGQQLDINAYKRYDWDKGTLVWVEQPDSTTVGEKKGKIRIFPITYTITLKVTQPGGEHVSDPDSSQKVPTITPVTDTKAPIVTTKELVVYAEDYEDNGVTPEQFILDIDEESEYIIKDFTEIPKDVYGIIPVSFIVEDSFGNSSKAESQLILINCKKTVQLELADNLPEPEDFLYTLGSKVSFLTDISSVNMMEEGYYTINLSIDDVEVKSSLVIEDTTPPNLALKPVEYWLNKQLDASSFVNYNDSCDASGSFEVCFTKEPDWSLEGEQAVYITAYDKDGNSVSKDTTLFLKKDPKAPVVSVTDIDVQVGGTISYKKAVTYYDDVDTFDELKLTIDRSGVNLKEIGTYTVTYTVTDCSGNATSVNGTINVMQEAPKWQDEDAIHKKAQDILDSILKDGMTDREKAQAIYKWIKNNIGYISHSEKGNYTRGAYEGLFKKEGDCFVYASTAKELLTQAGIPNIDIVKATTNPSHYWNLVYIEDGWYHFDSTPRKDKSQFFLLTDAELEAYSSTHNNTHIFDRSLYPEIK